MVLTPFIPTIYFIFSTGIKIESLFIWIFQPELPASTAPSFLHPLHPLILIPPSPIHCTDLLLLPPRLSYFPVPDFLDLVVHSSSFHMFTGIFYSTTASFPKGLLLFHPYVLLSTFCRFLAYSISFK